MGKYLFNKTVLWNSILGAVFGGLAIVGVNAPTENPFISLICITVAGNIFSNLVQKFIDFIEIRFLGKSPDKSVPPVSRDKNSARNEQSSSMQIELGGSFYSFSGFLIFLALMGYFVFLIIQNKYNPQILIWVFFCYGALLYILWLQIKGMSQPVIKKNAAGSVMLFLLILSSLYFVYPATAKEFFSKPMDGRINIIVSVVDDTSQIIYEDLQKRVKNLHLKDVQFLPYRSLEGEDDAQKVADKHNAHIVIWGEKASWGYFPRFLIRGFDEGEGEITDAINQNYPDRGTMEHPESLAQERAKITITFVEGLIQLFYEKPRDAIHTFQHTIDVLKKAEGFGTTDNCEEGCVEDTVYFFKCRAHSVVGQNQEALVACQHTIDINPVYTWAYMVKGTIYYSMSLEHDPSDENLMQQALDEYRKVLQVYTIETENLPPDEAYVQAKTYVNIANTYVAWADEWWNDDQNFTVNAANARNALYCALYLYGENVTPSELCQESLSNQEKNQVPGRHPARVYYGLGELEQLEGDRLDEFKSDIEEDSKTKYKAAQAEYLRCQKLAKDDPETKRAKGTLELCNDALEKIKPKLN